MFAIALQSAAAVKMSFLGIVRYSPKKFRHSEDELSRHSLTNPALERASAKVKKANFSMSKAVNYLFVRQTYRSIRRSHVMTAANMKIPTFCRDGHVRCMEHVAQTTSTPNALLPSVCQNFRSLNSSSVSRHAHSDSETKTARLYP